MGSFGKTKTTQQSTAVNTPWSAQTPFLTEGFQAAKDALGQANTAPKPDQFVAQFSPESLNIFKQMMGATGNPTAGTSSAIGTQVGQAGANALVDGFKQLAGWSPTGDTSSNIAAATSYADNPAVSGMVDSAMRGAEREAFERYLPQAGRQAAASGNLNSSKERIREGIVARGLAEKRGDIEADLRGNLYDSGLKLAENARQFDNDSVLRSMLGTISGGTAAAGTGVNALNSGVDQLKGLFDIARGGIEGQQAAAQAPIDDALARFQFDTNAPFAGLKNYWDIISSENWGGTQQSNSTGTQTASPAAVIGGLLGAAGSFFKPGK